MYVFTIIGGGIVGLSTSWALRQRFPDAKILVLEKESTWAQHQTGHNSGVIHSGIYYKPGSLKAKLAREGNREMISFCQEHGIEYDQCGKVIVATKPEELPLLDRLYEQGLANELKIVKIAQEELAEIEPHVNGISAIRLPSVGIVNYKQVSEKLAYLLQQHGVDMRLNTKVESIRGNEQETVLETTQGTFRTKYLVNCAGLHSDRVAEMDGAVNDLKIIPFRGEYYELRPEKRYLVKHLIYPVPNPNFPFLGVHFTRMIGGHVDVGPNAVLSLKREGYRKTDISLKDATEIFTYSGFWKLAMKYWRNGMNEMIQSFNKSLFVKNAQQLIPEIQKEDLIPASAGVRAQALKRDGSLVDDFFIQTRKNSIHVCNAPSPAATASLPIGRYIANTVVRQFELS